MRPEWRRIARLMDNSELRKQIGERGRKRILEKYDLDQRGPSGERVRATPGGARVRAILPAFWIGVGVVAAALSLPGTFSAIAADRGRPAAKTKALRAGMRKELARSSYYSRRRRGIWNTSDGRKPAERDHEGFEMDVVVVADNCSDRTAEMAAQAGAIDSAHIPSFAAKAMLSITRSERCCRKTGQSPFSTMRFWSWTLTGSSG